MEYWLFDENYAEHVFDWHFYLAEQVGFVWFHRVTLH